MAFMGGMQAQKDKWSLSADLIYLSLDKQVNRDAGYIDAITDVDGNVSLKSWIVTPAVGYAIHESESSRVEIVGGVRYLWLKSGANVEFDTTPVFDEAVSKSYWDAIIGVRARFDLNDKWFMPMYADIGTGDADITWQGFAGVGYKFEKVKAVFGYRYLQYEFDSDNRVMGEMTVNGPLLGLVMNF